MSQAYDYQELIDELKEDIGFGILNKKDMIQVLRSDEAIDKDYYPIIDWHYNKETMDIELAPDPADTKEDIADKKMIRAQYVEDLPNLEEITVEACLAEMFDHTNK